MPDQSQSRDADSHVSNGSRDSAGSVPTRGDKPQPPRGRRRWLVAAAIAALLAGALYAWWRTGYGPTAASGPLVLYGNVEIRQVDLAFGVDGTISNVFVDEGDRVEADQVLAILEQEPFVQSQAAAAAALTSAQARLAELLAGFRSQEIDEARATVASGEAAIENANINLKRIEQLFKTGNAPPQALDAAQLVQRTADAVLRQARATLSLRMEGTRTEQIDQQRAEVEARRASLGIQNYRLVKSKLLAPNAGIVLTRIREPGAVVVPNSPVLTVSVIDPVWVRTYVDEPNLGHLVPGAPVRVETDGGKSYAASVGYVSPTAEFTPRSVEAPSLRTELVYRVRIIVANPDGNLRQGMPTTITVSREAPGSRP